MDRRPGWNATAAPASTAIATDPHRCLATVDRRRRSPLAPSTRRSPSGCASRSLRASSNPATGSTSTARRRIRHQPHAAARGAEGAGGRGAGDDEAAPRRLRHRDVGATTCTQIYHLLALLESDAAGDVAEQPATPTSTSCSRCTSGSRSACGSARPSSPPTSASTCALLRDRRQPLADAARRRPAQGDEAQPPPFAAQAGPAGRFAGRTRRADGGAAIARPDAAVARMREHFDNGSAGGDRIGVIARTWIGGLRYGRRSS